MLESYGGQIHDSATAAPPEAVVSSLASDAIREAYMHNRGTAAILLSNADPTRFGSLLSALSNAYSIPDQPPVALPAEILTNNPNVTLCIDIFYVLGLPFFLSTSRYILFLSCRPMMTRSKKVILSNISSNLVTYCQRGFCPTDIHADRDFNVFKNLFPGVCFSICSADDHVPEVECAIRTIKDTVRATIHGLPYHRIPRVMVQELVEALAFQQNMPLIVNDHMVHKYNPDDVVDESIFDRKYQPTSDHESDQNLTSDAYTDSTKSDASETSDDDSDNGHHDDYDSQPAPLTPPQVLPPIVIQHL
jgi:hypothetical protein